MSSRRTSGTPPTRIDNTNNPRKDAKRLRQNKVQEDEDLSSAKIFGNHFIERFFSTVSSTCNRRGQAPGQMKMGSVGPDQFAQPNGGRRRGRILCASPWCSNASWWSDDVYPGQMKMGPHPYTKEEVHEVADASFYVLRKKGGANKRVR